jgi:hypothetical protein
MWDFAKTWAERRENGRNLQFRAATRRNLAREASLSLGSAAEDAALDELEARLWNRIDAQISDEARTPRRPARSVTWRRVALASPLLAAAALVLVFYCGFPRRTAEDGLKGEAVYAPLVEALRIAVVDPEGHVQRAEAGMHVKTGTPLVFAAEVRGLDAERGLAVDLTYAVDGGSEQPVLTGFALKHEREPFAKGDGYVAFKPTKTGEYRFRLTAVGEPANARETRIHVEESDP